MSAYIKFNDKNSKWEAFANGRRVWSATRKPTLEKYLAANFSHIKFQDMAAIGETTVAVPKEYFSVDERFGFIEQFVSLIARKVMHSLIITGDGGLGKTYTVMETLKKRGLREESIGDYNGDFVVVKGYSTPKALYRTLWENNGKIIIFDDADAVHKDPIGANLLKAALESSQKRVITWGAEFAEREELPNRFQFTGQVIFISNLSLAKFPQALLSRSMKVDLTLSTEEKVSRIEHVLNEIDADSSDKSAVLSFIKTHAAKFTDLNIRSAMNILMLRKQFGANFERISLYNALS